MVEMTAIQLVFLALCLAFGCFIAGSLLGRTSARRDVERELEEAFESGKQSGLSEAEAVRMQLSRALNEDLFRIRDGILQSAEAYDSALKTVEKFLTVPGQSITTDYVKGISDSFARSFALAGSSAESSAPPAAAAEKLAEQSTEAEQAKEIKDEVAAAPIGTNAEQPPLLSVARQTEEAAEAEKDDQIEEQAGAAAAPTGELPETKQTETQQETPRQQEGRVVKFPERAPAAQPENLSPEVLRTAPVSFAEMGKLAERSGGKLEHPIFPSTSAGNS